MATCAEGHEVEGGAKFCPECGLPVQPPEKQPEIWVPERKADAPPTADAGATGWWTRTSTASKVAVVAAAVVVLGLTAVLLTQAGGDDDTEGFDGDESAFGDVEIDPAAPCASLWNEAPDTVPREIVAKMAIGPADSYAPVYAKVGYSADAPERCLITVAQPDNGQALQFLQRSDGSFLLGTTTNIRALDPSNKEWNTYADADGEIYFGEPRPDGGELPEAEPEPEAPDASSERPEGLSAGAVATAFFEAWATGDRSRAALYGTADAVEAMFEEPWNDDSAFEGDCYDDADGEDPLFVCEITYRGSPLTMTLGLVDAQEWAVFQIASGH